MYTSMTVVIPVYNESGSIIKTLESIERNITVRHTINLIYDFDEDTTVAPVQNYTRTHMKNNINLVKNKFGRGALNAIKTGFLTSNGEPVLVVMADMSDDLSRVDEMFDKINQGYDLVCGSRYMPGGKQIGGPLLKRTLSRMAGVSLHYLAGLPTHDVTNSFKLYSKKVLDAVTIESDGGFELGMEIVVKSFAKGYAITEVPTTWTDRSEGQSRFRLFKWLPKYFHWYMYALKNQPDRTGQKSLQETNV